MIRLRSLIMRFAHDACGAMAVETALVAPALALMALGTFDVTNMVSKQEDLQSAAGEATEIILAAAGGSGVSSTDLHDIIVSSLNLQDNQVTITQLFRCDASTTTTTDASTCDTSKPIYQYVKLQLTDSYTPAWTNFGVGHTINYDVERTVQTA
jgi:Flp pilus assembly protein TadG